MRTSRSLDRYRASRNNACLTCLHRSYGTRLYPARYLRPRKFDHVPTFGWGSFLYYFARFRLRKKKIKKIDKLANKKEKRNDEKFDLIYLFQIFAFFRMRLYWIDRCHVGNTTRFCLRIASMQNFIWIVAMNVKWHLFTGYIPKRTIRSTAFVRDFLS